jgi:hypothetical protein
MAKQIINNGDSGLLARTKINDNFTEVYTSVTAATTGLDGTTTTVRDFSASWVNVSTNLSQITATNTLQLSSSTGNSITISAATSATAGLMSSQDKTTLTILTTAYNALNYFPTGNTVDYLLVAGGGGGGGSNLTVLRRPNVYEFHGGGGGGGGVMVGTRTISNGDTFDITIGAGGTRDQSGNNSSILAFLNKEALGGGSGGINSNDTFKPPEAGGSGGGGSYNQTGQLGTLGQGKNGGNGYYNSARGYGGGGGGYLSAGYTPTNNTANGGTGLNWLSSGTIYVAGGGSGGYYTSIGGEGGGGSAGVANILDEFKRNGRENTGGGGCGGTYGASNDGLSAHAGNGGSGVCYFRWPAGASFVVTTNPPQASTISQTGGYKYLKVKSSCVATFA